MTPRFQRLLIIIMSLIFIAISAILILINSKNNIVFFYTPTELLNSSININDKVRIGGFVKNNSIKNLNDVYNFTISDNKNEINIEFKGILPDLFREDQGAVIEGVLINKNTIIASKVFAKHDENYMPSSIKKQLEEKDYWEKEY